MWRTPPPPLIKGSQGWSLEGKKLRGSGAEDIGILLRGRLGGLPQV
jgi:hypothetical protein